MLPSYLFLRVTHLQRTLSHFTRNTLIEAAILFRVIPKYQPTSVVGNIVILLCIIVEVIFEWLLIYHNYHHNPMVASRHISRFNFFWKGGILLETA